MNENVSLLDIDDIVAECMNEANGDAIRPAEAGLDFVLPATATLARHAYVILLVHEAALLPAFVCRIKELTCVAQGELTLALPQQ